MKQTFNNIIAQHKILGICSLISFLLLIIFMISKYLQFKGLELEPKWLIVSGVPVLIGLFIGEYVKSFKGFGIEIEASLKAELPTNLISPIVEESIVDINSLDKTSLGDLSRLNVEKRQKISRLRFVLGKRNYYDGAAFQEYIEKLKNLKYIEIVDHNGKFEFLIPISYFRSDNNILPDKIDNFISQIGNKTLTSNFPEVITSFVKQDESLLEAYQKLLSNTRKIEDMGDKKLPVLDSDKKLVGLLSKIKVEEFISKQVLENYNSKNIR